MDLMVFCIWGSDIAPGALARFWVFWMASARRISLVSTSASSTVRVLTSAIRN